MLYNEYCLVDNKGQVIERSNGSEGHTPIKSRDVRELEKICSEDFDGMAKIKIFLGKSRINPYGPWVYTDLPKNHPPVRYQF